MPIKRLVRKTRSRFSNRLPALYRCEALEPRTLLNAIPADGVIGNTVTIKGTAGNDVITISSHSDRLGIRQFVDWSINGGPTQSAGVSPIDRIFVDTGTGEDEVNVLSTPAVGMTIQGDSATEDILNLGVNSPNGLQGIHGAITVLSTSALWGISADDSADTASRTGTLSDGSLTGLASANITWDPSKCTGLLVNTGSGGGNTLDVFQTNVQTTIQGHSTGADDTLVVGNPTDGLVDITGHVTLASPMPTTGLWHLTIDDQAHSFSGTYLLDDGSIGVGPGDVQNIFPKINWISNAVRDLTVKTGMPSSAGAVSDVFIFNVDVPTTIVGDSPNLSVEAGASGNGHTTGVQGIVRPLYVTDLAGSGSLDVGQSNDPTPRTVTLHTILLPGDSAPWGAIDGLAPATIAYRYADMRGAGLGLGGGQSAPATVNVLATGTSVGIAGAATVAVGEGGSVQKIGAHLGIFGGAVTIDDSADTVSRNVSVSLVDASPGGGFPSPAVAISGLNSGGIQCAPGNTVSTVNVTTVIDCGPGNNAVTINAPPLPNSGGLSLPPILVTVNTGSGNDTVQVLASAFGAPLTISGQAGDDAFTITYGNSLTDNVVVNGGDGFNTLTLNSPTANTPIDLKSGAVAFSPSIAVHTTTTYSGIQTLALNTGAYTVSGDLGGVNVNTSGFATIKVQATTHLGALNIGGGTQVTLAAGATPLSKTIFCTGLSIGTGGKLDLANNTLQLTYSGADPVAAVRSYLASGYSNGAWNGNGIITSAADANHALGFGDSPDGTVAGLPANTISIRWTRLGDVNLDGKVGFADLVAVARNYGKTGQNWDQGDVNYDGAVGFDDLIAVARNYGATAAVQSASAILATAPLEMPIKTRRRR